MHADYTLLMSMALDDEATPAEMQRLKDHLRACAACANVWERWQVVDRRLEAAPLVSPSPTFTDNVMARIAAQSVHTHRRRSANWGVVVASLFGALLALSAVIALVYWGLQNQGQVSAVFFAALKGMGTATWLLLGLLRLMSGLGAPTLAVGVGLLATATCLLSMLWLWVVGRGHVMITQTVSEIPQTVSEPRNYA